MEKSFNMLVEETKNSVIDVITASKLPATVVQMLLREVLQGVETQTQLILQQEKAQYQKTLKEEGEKDDCESTGK